MICFDPNKRITIEKIKSHSFFKLGLIKDYIIPTPLKYPFLSSPIFISNISNYLLKVYKSLGYSSEELELEFTSNKKTSAKFLYYYLKSNEEEFPFNLLNNLKLFKKKEFLFIRSHLIDFKIKKIEVLTIIQQECQKLDYFWVHPDDETLLLQISNNLEIIIYFNSKNFLEIHQLSGNRLNFINFCLNLEKILINSNFILNFENLINFNCLY